MSTARCGLLGKAIVQPWLVTSIYYLPAIPPTKYSASKAATHASVYINILNKNQASATVDIYVATSSAVTTVDLIETGLVLENNATFVRGAIRMSAGEGIFVVSTLPIVVRVDGYEGVVI